MEINCSHWHLRNRLYHDMEDIAAALPYAQKAVDIRQALFPGGHRHLTHALNNLAKLKALMEK